MITRRGRLSAAALMLVVSVALVGCGSTAATPTPVAATPTPDSSASAEVTPAPSVVDAVKISGFAFSPATITVPVGTKVTWTNEDSAPHTVTSDEGTTLNSGNLATGATFSFTFTTAGTFAYHCALHPSMKGTVIVTG